MEKMTKEELLKAIKKAKEHKEQAVKQTAKEWKYSNTHLTTWYCQGAISCFKRIWASITS